ncbi:MAG TPA: DUF3037 domain-containing protein [Gemmatimonadales bacterium]|jgi:hypothetical protein|nr:DUF3037 domain-containing protein [Gemmatimonadales bacterium]
MKNCEYFLVQYVPSVLGDLRVPIGLFLFESAGRLIDYRITQSWRQVRCLDPDADMALLENLPAHFRQFVAADQKLYERLCLLREESSNSIQISPPRGVETADPQVEFLRLYQEHVERPRPSLPKRALREGSRPWIHARLREALERHALWDRVSKDVPVEQFTAPGDGFRIDAAYQPNGITKYLHALSLERDWNQAKLLSYTFWRIREKSPAHLTAIVADADSSLPSVQSCRQILTEAQIAIRPLSLLDPFLNDVKRELGLG